MKTKKKFSIMPFIPFINIATIIIIMAILTAGKTLRPANWMTILEQSITVIVGGIGAIFVMTTGSVDFSIGSLACMAGMCASMWAMKYGLIVMFLMAIAVGLLSGLFFGTATSRFKVPSFMVGVALQNGYRGFIAFYLSSGQILATQEVLNFDRMAIKLPVALVLVAITWYVFEYTRYGKYLKAMGENEKCARVSGINTDRMRRIAYLISGTMAGICGIFFLARVGGMSTQIGKGLEMRALLAFILGGAAIGGGFSTKMYKMVLGGLSVIILENGMTIAGITGGAYQIVEAVLLVGVIAINRLLTNKAILRDELESKRLKAEAEAAEAAAAAAQQA